MLLDTIVHNYRRKGERERDNSESKEELDLCLIQLTKDRNSRRVWHRWGVERDD